MLRLLRRLLETKGTLSGILIDESEDMPSSAAYRHRFRGLLRAYQLIGYTPRRDHAYLEINRRLREQHRKVSDELVAGIRTMGASVAIDSGTDLLTINNEFTASLILVRCRQPRSGVFRWFLRLDSSLSPDVTIAARLSPDSEEIYDYYLLPSIDALSERLRLAPKNGFLLDVV